MGVFRGCYQGCVDSHGCPLIKVTHEECVDSHGVFFFTRDVWIAMGVRTIAMGVRTLRVLRGMCG